MLSDIEIEGLTERQMVDRIAKECRCRICGWIVSRTIPHPCLGKVTRLPP